jgi:hypothetical protein
MPWSSSTEYKWTEEPHLTSTRCSRALSDFFLAPVDLSIATESSSHPSGLLSLYGQPYVYAGGGLGNMYECTLQICLAGGTGRDSLTFASVCVPDKCTALDLAADDFVEKLHLASEASADPKLAYEYNVLHERIAELNKFLGTGWTLWRIYRPLPYLSLWWHLCPRVRRTAGPDRHSDVVLPKTPITAETTTTGTPPTK